MLSSAATAASGPSAMSALLAASSSSSTSSETSTPTQQQQQLAAAAAAAAAQQQQQQQAAALAAMAATRNFLEKISSSHGLHPPVQVELKEDTKDLAAGGFRAWAVEDIPSGTRYGPFLGKWVQEPANHKFAWEVSVPVLTQ